MILSQLSTGELLHRLQGPGLRLRTGPFTLSIRTTVGSVREGLRRLYADFPLVESPDFADFHVSLMPRLGLRRWLLPEATFSLDGYFSYDPFALRMAPAYFEWGLNSCISRNVHHYLTLHGAIVEKSGQGLILLGESGAGKSTLCAALVASGWRLLSDELTLIHPQSLEISPLARPLSLKNESIAIVRELMPRAEFGIESQGSHKGTITHLKPPRESVERIQETVLPSRILFVRYDPSAPEPEIKEIPTAAAHLRVARHSFNYGILAEVGFDTLNRVVSRSRVLDFRYGHLPAALNLLNSHAFLDN